MLTGVMGRMKLERFIGGILVGAVSLGLAAYVTIQWRENSIIRNCEVIRQTNQIRQLQACNPFLRHENGCLLPASNLRLDRSCLDESAVQLTYQNCIDGVVFWDDPIQPELRRNILATSPP